MRITRGRKIFTASLLSAGLMTWSGCSTENSDGTPTNLGKMEKKAGEIEKKIEAGAEKAGEKIKEGAKEYGDEAKKDFEKVKEGAHVAGEKIKEGAEKVKEAVTPEKKPE